MSVQDTDLVEYLAASRPDDDVSTVGGAIDTTAKPNVVQWSSNAVAAAISDGADVRTLTVRGRLATGVIDTEVLTLTGAVEVVGAKTWERILSATLSASSGSRTVLLKQGSGGTTRATFIPGDVVKRIFFVGSASAALEVLRYEKFFWKNNHGSLALTEAAVTLTADPADRIRIGLATAVDGSTTIATRITAPAGVSFVDDSVEQGVPGGSLASGSAIGVWVEQDLPAADPAGKSTFTTQLAGLST